MKLVSTKRRLIWLVPFFLFLTAACSGPARESFVTNESTQSRIIGGQLAKADQDPGYWSVGLLQIQMQMNYTVLDETVRDKSSQACSAVLIESDVLLTAAHCVIDSQLLGMLSSGEASFKGEVFFPQTMQSLALQKALFHKDFANNESFDEDGELVSKSENDLAVILLEKPVASPLRAAIPAANFFNDSKSTRLQTRIYGFGISNVNSTAPAWTDSLLRFVDIEGAYWPKSKKIHYNQTEGQGVCYGDSGGPHFLSNPEKTQALLLAISSSLRKKKDSSGDPCLQRSDATAVQDYLPWIRSAIQKIRKEGASQSVQPH